MPLRPLLCAFLCVCGSAAAQTLQSFRLPWNDASSGPTNLKSWQPAEAGSSGWISVDANGHYQIGGERIRFLGVNVTAAGCFPSAAQATAHAQRLARFGFNSVRFHHMEAPWDKANVLVDYASGTSRQLSSERLNRLHYFVAELAKQGIYTDINLLVSREFQPGDGLGSEISQLDWKRQHVLGLFMDAALALHKEYATELLTAPNPYRNGKSLAQDPAVAFVEILNENGFAQEWHDGNLDKLPAVYASALKASWNAWLQARYANEAALLAAWGARDVPLGSAIFSNGDFANGTTGWNLERHSGAQATATTDTSYNSQPAVVIAVTTPGTQGWHVQFTRGPFALAADQVYTLEFAAKASTATPLSATLTRAGLNNDYTAVSPSLSPTLSTDWKTYSLTFVAGQNEPDVRLVVNGFGDKTTTVSLAAVSVRPGGKVGGLGTGESLAAGNIAVLKKLDSSAVATGQSRDWFRYMFDQEKRYWDSMYAHLKTTLGYPGIVFGTIMSNAPANPQAGLDAIDTHSYWSHPVFPVGQDFNTENWTVENKSLVDNPLTSTLAQVSRQRVKGKPLNLTEYQHASPNSYASETPLLAAAYGALQDWDGIWMFEYSTGTAEYITGWFDTGGHPGKMVNNLLAAAIFRRGDVGPARRLHSFAMTPDAEIDVARTLGRAWSIADGSHLGVPANLFTESRVALAIGAGAEGLATMPTAPSVSSQISDTGELKWTAPTGTQGLLTLNTPRTRALVGRATGQTVDLGGVVFRPGNTRLSWCTLGATLTEGDRFGDANAARGVIIATGDMENTGQQWKDTTKVSVGSKWGSAPVLVEVIPATITLPYPANRVRVWSLDGQGQRLQELTIRSASDKAQFDLGASGTTLWYEFEISSGTAQAPSIAAQPISKVVSLGSSVTLSARAAGNPAPTLQWYHNGAAVPGATGSTLTLHSVQPADLGAYQLRATNASGVAETFTATLADAAVWNPIDGRLVNVSTRGNVGVGLNMMVAGWVLEGDRKILVRGSGPILAKYGVTGLLPNPVLDVRRPAMTEPLFFNDNWDPSLADLFKTVGASTFDNSTKEAALVLDLPGGIFTADLKDPSNATGIALVELYDLGTGSGRITNLSTRGVVGKDADALIVGFVIAGNQPKEVLVRAVGPSMALQGIDARDTCGDPRLTLFRMVEGKPYEFLTNDDWADYNQEGLRARFAQIGAAPLPENSQDAALAIVLEPGIYTAKMETKGKVGIGMVEIYEFK